MFHSEEEGKGESEELLIKPVEGWERGKRKTKPTENIKTESRNNP